MRGSRILVREGHMLHSRTLTPEGRLSCCGVSPLMMPLNDRVAGEFDVVTCVKDGRVRTPARRGNLCVVS